MGGSKSKPVVESARQVLAKRKVDTEAVSSAVRGMEANLIPYITVWYDPEIALRGSKYKLDENDLSADMVHEMSKWDLFSSTTEGTQVLDKSAKLEAGDVASAALLRIQEEKEVDKQMAEIVRSNVQNRTSVPAVRQIKGRISEHKLVAMYNKFRDAPKASYSVKQASVEFGLPEETIEVLLEIARSPLIEEHRLGGPDDLKLLAR